MQLVSRYCEQVAGGRIIQFLLNLSFRFGFCHPPDLLGAPSPSFRLYMLPELIPIAPPEPRASYDLHAIDLIQRHFGCLDGTLEHSPAAFHQWRTLFLKLLAASGEGLELVELADIADVYCCWLQDPSGFLVGL